MPNDQSLLGIRSKKRIIKIKLIIIFQFGFLCATSFINKTTGGFGFDQLEHNRSPTVLAGLNIGMKAWCYSVSPCLEKTSESCWSTLPGWGQTQLRVNFLYSSTSETAATRRHLWDLWIYILRCVWDSTCNWNKVSTISACVSTSDPIAAKYFYFNLYNINWNFDFSPELRR